jgi:hypothetical protein
MRRYLVILVFLVISQVTGCMATSSHTPTPPPQKTWIVENAGWICFREYNLSARELGGIFRPKGCFSSTCTRRQEEKIDTETNRSQMELRFSTRVVVLDIATHTPQEQVCSADCNSDDIAFKFADVVTGTYTVVLGDQELGNLEVPPAFKEVEGICFGDW